MTPKQSMWYKTNNTTVSEMSPSLIVEGGTQCIVGLFPPILFVFKHRSVIYLLYYVTGYTWENIK